MSTLGEVRSIRGGRIGREEMERRRRGEERRREETDETGRVGMGGRGIIIITHYPGIKKRDSDRHPYTTGREKKERKGDLGLTCERLERQASVQSRPSGGDSVTASCCSAATRPQLLLPINPHPTGWCQPPSCSYAVHYFFRKLPARPWPPPVVRTLFTFFFFGLCCSVFCRRCHPPPGPPPYLPWCCFPPPTLPPPGRTGPPSAKTESDLLILGGLY